MTQLKAIYVHINFLCKTYALLSTVYIVRVIRRPFCALLDKGMKLGEKFVFDREPPQTWPLVTFTGNLIVKNCQFCLYFMFV